MSRFVTVDKNDANYLQYLKGTFSSAERAIPVQINDGASLHSKVTFQILNVSDIKAPSLFFIFAQLFRFDLLSLTLLPALAVWLFYFENSQLSHLHSILLFCSLFFLHAAACAFNDYFDHMQGRDRLNEKSGSRVIQLGYLRAQSVLKWAWFCWGLASLGGIYLSLQNPYLIAFAAFGALLGALGSMYGSLGLKGVGFSDLAVLIGLGPLLTLSIEFVVMGQLTLPIFVLGLIFGLLTSVYTQAKSLASSLLDYQARVKTLPVRLGFDRAKIFMSFEMLAAIGLYFYFLSGLQFSGLVFAFLCVVTILFLLKLKSPLSSQTQKLSTRILWLHYAFGFIVIFNRLI